MISLTEVNKISSSPVTAVDLQGSKAAVVTEATSLPKPNFFAFGDRWEDRLLAYLYGKGLIDEQGRLNKDHPELKKILATDLPGLLKESVEEIVKLLRTPVDVISRLDNETKLCSVPPGELLASYKKQQGKGKVVSSELIGGALASILTVAYYKMVFIALGVENVDELFPPEAQADLYWPPSDTDWRLNVPNADYRDLEDWEKRVIQSLERFTHDLPTKYKSKYDYVKEEAFKKLKVTCNGICHYLTATFGDGKQNEAELLLVQENKKRSLFVLDSLHLIVDEIIDHVVHGKAVPSNLVPQGDKEKGWQAVLDHATKLLYAEDFNLMRENGWPRMLSYIMKGARIAQPGLENILLEKALLGCRDEDAIVAQLSSLLVKCLKDHHKNDPYAWLLLGLNACSFLKDAVIPISKEKSITLSVTSIGKICQALVPQKSAFIHCGAYKNIEQLFKSAPESLTAASVLFQAVSFLDAARVPDGKQDSQAYFTQKAKEPLCNLAFYPTGTTYHLHQDFHPGKVLDQLLAWQWPADELVKKELQGLLSQYLDKFKLDPIQTSRLKKYKDVLGLEWNNLFQKAQKLAVSSDPLLKRIGWQYLLAIESVDPSSDHFKAILTTVPQLLLGSSSEQRKQLFSVLETLFAQQQMIMKTQPFWRAMDRDFQTGAEATFTWLRTLASSQNVLLRNYAYEQWQAHKQAYSIHPQVHDLISSFLPDGVSQAFQIARSLPDKTKRFQSLCDILRAAKQNNLPLESLGAMKTTALECMSGNHIVLKPEEKQALLHLVDSLLAVQPSDAEQLILALSKPSGQVEQQVLAIKCLAICQKYLANNSLQHACSLVERAEKAKIWCAEVNKHHFLLSLAEALLAQPQVNSRSVQSIIGRIRTKCLFKEELIRLEEAEKQAEKAQFASELENLEANLDQISRTECFNRLRDFMLHGENLKVKDLALKAVEQTLNPSGKICSVWDVNTLSSFVQSPEFRTFFSQYQDDKLTIDCQVLAKLAGLNNLRQSPQQYFQAWQRVLENFDHAHSQQVITVSRLLPTLLSTIWTPHFVPEALKACLNACLPGILNELQGKNQHDLVFSIVVGMQLAKCSCSETELGYFLKAVHSNMQWLEQAPRLSQIENALFGFQSMLSSVSVTHELASILHAVIQKCMSSNKKERAVLWMAEFTKVLQRSPEAWQKTQASSLNWVSFLIVQQKYEMAAALLAALSGRDGVSVDAASTVWESLLEKTRRTHPSVWHLSKGVTLSRTSEQKRMRWLFECCPQFSLSEHMSLFTAFNVNNSAEIMKLMRRAKASSEQAEIHAAVDWFDQNYALRPETTRAAPQCWTSYYECMQVVESGRLVHVLSQFEEVKKRFTSVQMRKTFYVFLISHALAQYKSAQDETIKNVILTSRASWTEVTNVDEQYCEIIENLLPGSSQTEKTQLIDIFESLLNSSTAHEASRLPVITTKMLTLLTERPSLTKAAKNTLLGCLILAIKAPAAELTAMQACQQLANSGDAKVQRIVAQLHMGILSGNTPLPQEWEKVFTSHMEKVLGTDSGLLLMAPFLVHAALPQDLKRKLVENLAHRLLQRAKDPKNMLEALDFFSKYVDDLYANQKIFPELFKEAIEVAVRYCFVSQDYLNPKCFFMKTMILGLFDRACKRYGVTTKKQKSEKQENLSWESVYFDETMTETHGFWKEWENETTPYYFAYIDALNRVETDDVTAAIYFLGVAQANLTLLIKSKSPVSVSQLSRRISDFLFNQKSLLPEVVIAHRVQANCLLRECSQRPILTVNANQSSRWFYLAAGQTVELHNKNEEVSNLEFVVDYYLKGKNAEALEQALMLVKNVQPFGLNELHERRSVLYRKLIEAWSQLPEFKQGCNIDIAQRIREMLVPNTNNAFFGLEKLDMVLEKDALNTAYQSCKLFSETLFIFQEFWFKHRRQPHDLGFFHLVFLKWSHRTGGFYGYHCDYMKTVDRALKIIDRQVKANIQDASYYFHVAREALLVLGTYENCTHAAKVLVSDTVLAWIIYLQQFGELGRQESKTVYDAAVAKNALMKRQLVAARKLLVYR